MSKNNSKAKTKYWQSIPPEVRSERMRKVAIAKNLSMTPDERKAHGIMMANKRWNK